MTRISERMKNIQKMSDELGAMGKGDVTKAGTFEVWIRQLKKYLMQVNLIQKMKFTFKKQKHLLEDPQIKGLYTEAEVKNAYDFEGLYQSHFDKGHVDIAMLLEQAGHNIPQMRSIC